MAEPAGPGAQPPVKLYDNRLFSEERQQPGGAQEQVPSLQQQQPLPAARRPAAPRHSTGSLPSASIASTSSNIATAWQPQRPQPPRSQLCLTGGAPAAPASTAESAERPQAASNSADGLPPRPMSPGRVLGAVAPLNPEQRRPRSSAGEPLSTQ